MFLYKESFRDTIRRMYHELVSRRSTVRISYSTNIDKLEEAPIFIIGVFRSGTTLLRYMIDSHSRICCPAESDFIIPLFSLVNDKYSIRGLNDMGFDEKHVKQKIRELCIYFFGNYAKAKKKPRWADKSPAYVDYLDFIEQLFPEAQYIIINRHPLDLVHSMTKGGKYLFDRIQNFDDGEVDLRIAGTRYWCEKTRKINEFIGKHPHKCQLIKYEELCNCPETIMKEVLEFIGEKWESEIVEFYKFEHDKGKEDGRIISTKGISVSKNNYKSWPVNIIDACAEEAKELMSDLGYEL